jgi:23S rRNA pseudouridine1911/1915/1917 synthase
MQNEKSFSITVSEEFDGERLDRWLSSAIEEASRSAVQRWIEQGCVIGPGLSVKASDTVEYGQVFTVTIPSSIVPDLEPVEMNLDVLYEDDQLAVIHKPYGIAVHPGPGQRKKTLINGILHRWRHLIGTDEFRPGIVHRLDSDTEGLLIVALNEVSHRKIASQFERRTVEKEYVAWLMSAPALQADRIELPIKRHRVERKKMSVDPKGRMAVTEYRIEKAIASNKGRKYAFATIRIETGRTHQIRVHMAHIGCPIVGDPIYSRSYREFEKFGMLLLARRLAFTHPVTCERVEFKIELPERFLEFERRCPHL